MKKGIHPEIYKDAVVTCACGTTFVTISTKKSITTEICSMCHPFYTGQQKFIDTEGRIDKYAKKLKKAQDITATKTTKTKKAVEETRVERTPQPTLKELLNSSKKKVS